MKHILTAILIFFTGNIFLSKSACNNKKETSSNETEENATDSILDIEALLQQDQNLPDSVSNIGTAFSKQELEKMLIELSKSEAPSELAVGAMCYKVARPPDRYEYICPLCEEKTLHTNSYAYFFQKELGACRRIANNLSRYGVALDETNFCSHCNKDKSSEEEGLCIIIQYKEEESHRCCSIRLEDLKILDAFFNGKAKYTGSHGNEIALKTKQERLEYLLNIEISE